MQQSADTVLLIRPSHFGFNPETAATNSFQQPAFFAGISDKALIEFNAFADRLKREDIGVITFDDQSNGNTPDAIFPNNWVSFHHDGTVVLYPMETPGRRRERRNDILESLQEQHGFTFREIIDLTQLEHKGQFLEGTGSIVFDHLNRIAYMAISSRSHPSALEQLCECIEYQQFTFNTTDPSGIPIYHTNVMLSLGSQFAVVCTSAISGKVAQTKLLTQLEKNGRLIVEISGAQMAAFAGNMLEVRNSKSDPFLVLSESAFKTLESKQKRTLEQLATLLPVAIPTIEKHGGGSVRCMMAEVFLPKGMKKIKVDVRSPANAQEFEEYFALRWKILRQPWNQPVGSEKDDLEDRSDHYVAITANHKIVGTGRLQLNDSKTAQVRFMAVADEFKGQGIGKSLMEKMEARAIEKCCNRIILQARENAVPFYKRLGYTIVEKTFLLYGSIQHFLMEKKLVSNKAP